MVNVVATWLDDPRVARLLFADRGWLIAGLRQLIQRDYDTRVRVIESAEAGNLLAHQALMVEFKEAFDNGMDMPATLKSYILRSQSRGEPRRGRGHTEWDNKVRDVGIIVLAEKVCRAFSLEPTRNEATRNWPCAASVVAKALKRKGIKLEEKRIANILTDPRSKWLRDLTAVAMERGELRFPKY